MKRFFLNKKVVVRAMLKFEPSWQAWYRPFVFPAPQGGDYSGTGVWRKAPCPIGDGRHVMSINMRSGFWRCAGPPGRKDHSHGDIFELARLLLEKEHGRRVSFPEAVAAVVSFAERAGVVFSAKTAGHAARWRTADEREKIRRAIHDNNVETMVLRLLLRERRPMSTREIETVVGGRKDGRVTRALADLHGHGLLVGGGRGHTARPWYFASPDEWGPEPVEVAEPATPVAVVATPPLAVTLAAAQVRVPAVPVPVVAPAREPAHPVAPMPGQVFKPRAVQASPTTLPGTGQIGAQSWQILRAVAVPPPPVPRPLARLCWACGEPGHSGGCARDPRGATGPVANGPGGTPANVPRPAAGTSPATSPVDRGDGDSPVGASA